MVQIRLLRQMPTGVEIEIVSTGQRLALSRSFVRKQIEAGIYEVVNSEEMPVAL